MLSGKDLDQKGEVGKWVKETWFNKGVRKPWRESLTFYHSSQLTWPVGRAPHASVRTNCLLLVVRNCHNLKLLFSLKELHSKQPSPASSQRLRKATSPLFSLDLPMVQHCLLVPIAKFQVFGSCYYWINSSLRKSPFVLLNYILWALDPPLWKVKKQSMLILWIDNGSRLLSMYLKRTYLK